MRKLMIVGVSIALSVALSLTNLAALGAPMSTSGLVAENVWSRATVPGARAAAVYMTLRNQGENPVTIARLATSVATMTDAHQTIEDGGMMRMRPAGELTIEPGEALAFEPGGLHIMLMGLEQPLAEGDHFQLQITTGQGQVLETQVVVGARDQSSMPGR